MRVGQVGESLGEDATGAPGVRAEEAADSQPQPGESSLTGQVAEHPSVSAVDTERGVPAERAAYGRGRRCEVEGESVVFEGGAVEAETGRGQEVFEQG
jgi:hypothetical protein